MTPNDGMLEACRHYVGLGWHLSPMNENKTPLTAHGYKDATNDLRRIEDWLRRFPAANIAVATGKSGLVVLDIDPRNGGDESFERLLAQTERAVGDAPRVLTPGDGFHLYFSSSGNWAGVLRGFPGIDVLSGGKLAILPFSRRGSKRYEWSGSDRERSLQPIPPSLMNLLAARPAASAIENATLFSSFVHGERNSNLTKTAGALRRQGYVMPAIAEMIGAANRLCCHPPLSDVEVQAIAKSVSRYAPAFDAVSYLAKWCIHRLTATEQRVLTVLARWANEKGETSPPMSEIERCANIEKSNGFAAVRALIKRGALKRTSRGTKAALYRLVLPP